MHGYKRPINCTRTRAALLRKHTKMVEDAEQEKANILLKRKQQHSRSKAKLGARKAARASRRNLLAEQNVADGEPAASPPPPDEGEPNPR